jgi:hypothetical protein
MNDLIEKIWNEEYKPAQDNVLFGEEIMRARSALDELERELWEHLGERERELFDKVMGRYYDMVDYYKKDAFMQGVRFAGGVLKEMILR